MEEFPSSPELQVTALNQTILWVVSIYDYFFFNIWMPELAKLLLKYNMAIIGAE